jgi:hypothetical protein
MAAGNFTVARRSYAARAGHSEAAEVFLYAIPRDPEGMHRVTVTVDAPSGPSHTITSTSVEHADVWRYFAVHLPIAEAGTYRLTMVSGTDKGCFQVRFKK